MEQFRKDVTLWYSRLQTRGKVVLGFAVAGFVWLLVQIIGNIALGSPILGGWPALLLNLVAGILIGLVVAQFFVMRNMQRNFEQNLRSSLTKGRRGGNRAEQISGMRNRGSTRNRGGNTMQSALQMVTQVSPEDLDKQYRPKPLSKPTLVDKWQEIEAPGMYALNKSPKAKVEIIDAADIGGGFFVARYSTKGLLKDRRFMTHRQTGEPLRFDTMRNAKKALDGGKSNKKKSKRR